MRICIYLTSLALAAASWPLSAESPIIADAKAFWTGVKNNVVKAAEKMPEENYSFKPTPEVRSFGQLVGHVADAQFMFCSMVKGEKRQPVNAEKMASKADLVAAVKESAAYCDAVLADLSDAKAMETIKVFGRDRTRIAAAFLNTSHSNEHYGNIVTYMRLKGLVPPSSEGR